MEKRTFQTSNTEASLLGFGCMRFPTLADGTIDETLSMKMLDDAIAAGVDYIDTAYPYHNCESEPFVGKALKKYDRASFKLATKAPMYLIQTLEDGKKYFAEQLERLQVEYFDFYLLHAMNKKRFELAKETGLIAYFQELKEQGLIRNLGFSFHDSYEVFEEMLEYRDWDFCQIQLNYIDTKEQAGIKGYELAEKKGVPIVIMEPIKGGMLADFSDDINQLFHDLNPEKSIASYALRWLAALPNVKVILSGMSTPEQVYDNLDTFTNYEPITEKELSTIDEVVRITRSRIQNGCTGCRYCMPCPVGVDIPGSFAIWNRKHMFEKAPIVDKQWANRADAEKPHNCIECGQCEAACPQGISIRADLKKVTADFQ